ncbi:MAG: ParB/RepB/Spo0J family partition protein [Infirmifilum sp.]
MNISNLKPHEKYIEERVELLLEELFTDGLLRKPVIADEKNLVLLDGHHRLEAFKRLGLAQIPVALVNYYDPRIQVKSWVNGDTYDKSEVISRALKGDLFPPRTTRHVVLVGDREVHISEVIPEVNAPLNPSKIRALSF